MSLMRDKLLDKMKTWGETHTEGRWNTENGEHYPWMNLDENSICVYLNAWDNALAIRYKEENPRLLATFEWGHIYKSASDFSQEVVKALEICTVFEPESK